MKLPGLLRCLLALALCLGCRARGDGPVPPPGEPLRILSYNTYYVFSKGTEVEAGSAWVAEQAPDVVALQELTDISHDRLTELAASWGHRHSALLKTSGFSVGLTSNRPIEVKGRLLDGLHHGCLHAHVAGIHFFVVHLSPFEWTKRTDEARLLLAEIQPLIEQQEDVVVLGDFNALSPADRGPMDAQPGALQKARTSDAEHDHVQNLREDQFDYSVMEHFLGAELQDAALPFLVKSKSTRWTFPTGIWSEDKETSPEGGSRIDFILTSPSLIGSVTSAGVTRAGVVNRTSDHYPVLVELQR